MSEEVSNQPNELPEELRDIYRQLKDIVSKDSDYFDLFCKRLLERPEHDTSFGPDPESVEEAFSEAIEEVINKLRYITNYFELIEYEFECFKNKYKDNPEFVKTELRGLRQKLFKIYSDSYTSSSEEDDDE